jgi:hypothetical protein
VVTSAVLFVVACALPAVVTYNTGNRETESMWGVTMLFVGWLGAFANLWGWFANPLLLLSLPLLGVGWYRAAFWAGIASVIVGLSTLSWYVHSIPADEGGSASRQLELSYPTLGFFCWMGSLVMVPASASILARQEAEAKAAAANTSAPT